MSDIKDKVQDEKKKVEENVKAAARAAAPAVEFGVEQATAKASDAWEATKNAGNRASEFASRQYDRVSRGAHDAYRRGREGARELEHNFEGYIQRRPLTAVLIGVGAGFILGLAMCKRR